jgi:hypothetical protein
MRICIFSSIFHVLETPEMALWLLLRNFWGHNKHVSKADRKINNFSSFKDKNNYKTFM